MKASMKRAWLEALRSGKFQQGRDYLGYQLPNGQREYCCLGVLCVVAGVKGEFKVDGTARRVLEFGQDATDGDEILPDDLAADLGIERNPCIPVQLPNAPYPNAFTTLAKANDDGLTFGQIADLIEYFIDADPDDLTDVTGEPNS